MYGIWYIAIGALALFIIAIIFLILSYKTNVFDELWINVTSFAVIVLSGACLFVSLIFSIGNPISAKKEYLEFEETRIIVEQIYESGGIEDNYGINTTIINSNQWLSKAKASKKQLGCWSSYYYIDIENIEPILLKSNKLKEQNNEN